MRFVRRPARILVVVAAVLAAILGVVVSAPRAEAAPTQPVAKLDVNRYLGTWWQLATVPSFYGIRCAKDTNATYGLIDAKTISVDNKCISFTGQPDGIKGKATVLDTKTNAQLAVSFPGIPNTINTGNFPNYIVTYVEDGADPTGPYKYAIVGDPTRLSGFLLSREKNISTDELRRLRGKVEQAGFNSCTFLVSPITGWRSDYSPLCTV